MPGLIWPTRSTKEKENKIFISHLHFTASHFGNFEDIKFKTSRTQNVFVHIYNLWTL